MWISPKDHEVVGERLAAARTGAKKTQSQLAKSLGKAQSFVSSYEAGQRRIDIMEFLVISEALGVDPVKLLTEIVNRRKKRS